VPGHLVPLVFQEDQEQQEQEDQQGLPVSLDRKVTEEILVPQALQEEEELTVLLVQEDHQV